MEAAPGRAEAGASQEAEEVCAFVPTQRMALHHVFHSKDLSYISTPVVIVIVLSTVLAGITCSYMKTPAQAVVASWSIKDGGALA